MRAYVAKYVIHRHNAFKAGLHYDLRIKYPNKKNLISFAIPKDRFPKLPKEKSIAIQTNDHGNHWLNTEKLDIPKGEYGGGYIKRVQYGDCKVYEWTSKFIKFYIDNGDFAAGMYVMFRTKNDRSGRSIWIIQRTLD